MPVIAATPVTVPGDSLLVETIPGILPEDPRDRAGPADGRGVPTVSLADRLFPASGDSPESPQWRLGRLIGVSGESSADLGRLVGEDATAASAGGNDGGPVNRSDDRSRSPKSRLRDFTVIQVLDANESNFVESREY